jgi:hypothetical protein
MYYKTEGVACKGIYNLTASCKLEKVVARVSLLLTVSQQDIIG